MWVLIIILSVSKGTDFKLEIVDNFESEQACRYAGAQQEVALRQDLQLKTNGKYTFVCVKKGN